MSIPKLPVVLALSLLAVVSSVHADSVFRLQLPSPILMSSSSGGGETSEVTLAVAGLPATPVELGYALAGQLTATGGSDQYVFTAGAGKPSFLIIGPDGSLSGNATVEGRYDFQVTATSAGVSSDPVDISLVVMPALGTLAVTSPGQSVMLPGQTFAATVTASAPVQGFTLTGAGFNGVADGLSYTVSGVVPASGTISYSVGASDAFSRTLASVGGSVAAATPVVATFPSISGYPGAEYGVPAVSGGVAPYAFSSPMPSITGSVDATTGAITVGRNAAAGTTQQTVTVRDALGQETPVAVPVTVTLPPLPTYASVSGAAVGAVVESSVGQIQGAGLVDVQRTSATGEFRICSDAACATVVRPYGTARVDVQAGSYMQLRTTAPAGGLTASTEINVASRPVTWGVTSTAVCSTVGQTCADGTKYAGNIGGRIVYAAPCDIGGTGNPATCAGGTQHKFTSSGSTITNYTSSSDPYFDTTSLQAKGGYPAASTCFGLRAANYLGHNDWYMPNATELTTILANRAAIGGFSNTTLWYDGYWSSTTALLQGGNKGAVMAAHTVDKPQGASFVNNTNALGFVRCVRHD